MKIKGIRMNGPDDLKDLLEHLQGSDDEGEETLIGTLPQYLATEFKEYVKKEMRLHQEMDGTIEELAVKMKNMVQQEYGERIAEMSDTHDEVWNKIYREMGLDPRYKYTVDRKTGKLFLSGDIKGNNPFTH